MNSPDRERGILTTDDRDYLTGRKNLAPDSERNTRLRLRTRTRNSLYDFQYLNKHLANKDITQLAIEDGKINEDVFSAAADAIGFIFKLCQQAPETQTTTTTDRFRNLLETGLKRGLADDHELLDFNLDMEYGIPRDARRRIQRKLSHGESLTLPELREAINNDYLDRSYQFRPLDEDGLPKNVDPEDILSHDDY